MSDSRFMKFRFSNIRLPAFFCSLNLNFDFDSNKHFPNFVLAGEEFSFIAFLSFFVLSFFFSFSLVFLFFLSLSPFFLSFLLFLFSFFRLHLRFRRLLPPTLIQFSKPQKATRRRRKKNKKEGEEKEKRQREKNKREENKEGDRKRRKKRR